MASYDNSTCESLTLKSTYKGIMMINIHLKVDLTIKLSNDCFESEERRGSIYGKSDIFVCMFICFYIFLINVKIFFNLLFLISLHYLWNLLNAHSSLILIST